MGQHRHTLREYRERHRGRIIRVEVCLRESHLKPSGREFLWSKFGVARVESGGLEQLLRALADARVSDRQKQGLSDFIDIEAISDSSLDLGRVGDAVSVKGRRWQHLVCHHEDKSDGEK